MSTRLVKVTETVWVDPTAVIAVSTYMGSSVRLALSSGDHVTAHGVSVDDVAATLARTLGGEVAPPPDSSWATTEPVGRG